MDGIHHHGWVFYWGIPDVVSCAEWHQSGLFIALPLFYIDSSSRFPMALSG